MFITYALAESQLTGISGVTIKKRTSEVLFLDGQTFKLPTKFIKDTSSSIKIFAAMRRYQFFQK